ncbi:DUF305 domain-containing protein [Actinoalloteichus spitiensis]|uniref:DUF305 domain-containing protein n=1 Tax=Actinoalloteichus spitiensis TaxID=252394 RepID=UPI00037F71ED|nr:DUF305 domain-containing protein [Actinoalloteichus spitiensis]
MRVRHAGGPGASGVGRLTVLALGAVLLAGCTASEVDEHAQAPAPPLVAPGGPGDEPRHVAPDGPLSAGQPEPNEHDLTFVDMMVPHHEQALEMAALAPGRAEDSRVVSLAGRIEGSQGPEIGAMLGWRDGVVDAAGHAHHGDHHGHDHADMPGMATREELAELAGSEGADFDRLFLHLMIAHHEGALEMTDEVLSRGADVTLQAMAADMMVGQTAEIDTMRELLG